MAKRKKKPIDYTDPKVRSRIYISRKWVKPFIEKLAEGYLPSEAAQAVHVKLGCVYAYAHANPSFKHAWAEARVQFATTKLEPVVMRICSEGLKKKKFTKSGEPIIDPETGEQYCEIEYPTALQAFVLKGVLPHIYGDKSKVEHTGSVQFNPITLDGDKTAADDV